MGKKLLVMAGGTGGHVFPAIAVAQELQQQGWEIRWLGTKDRMEAQLVPKFPLNLSKFQGYAARASSLYYWRLLRFCARCVRRVRLFNNTNPMRY